MKSWSRVARSSPASPATIRRSTAAAATTTSTGSGDATTNALYAATTFDITDRLRADVGVRYEEYEVDYTLDEGRAGTIDFAVSEDLSETSWTAALNYQFTDRMGVFGRINQGHLLPQFDTYRDSQRRARQRQ